MKESKIYSSNTLVKRRKCNTRKLDRISLIRPIYRTLIDKGRSYAGFDEKKVFPLVEKLARKKEILDPMSGYGSLMLYCSKVGIQSYCMEFSLPLYLWQILSHPANSSSLALAIDKLLSFRIKWPKISKRGIISDNWYSEESRKLILKLYNLIASIIKGICKNSKKTEESTLAILIPFVGRLSSSVPGNVTTHVKIGGITVYDGWQDDFNLYLHGIKNRILQIKRISKSSNHKIILGDCRVAKFPRKHFSAMITSPPYPNHRDFFSMFAPENDCLSWLHNERIIKIHAPGEFGIGTNVVSGRDTPVIENKTATRFINKLSKYKDAKRSKAQYDNEVYYIPYFLHYFHDLEQLYKNIISSLAKKFEGYIIVVNNTTRDQVIPVAQSTEEIWREQGFRVRIFDVHEKFHIGTKNPRARGFKAKHKEYILRIWRK